MITDEEEFDQALELIRLLENEIRLLEKALHETGFRRFYHQLMYRLTWYKKPTLDRLDRLKAYDLVQAKAHLQALRKP